MSAQKSWSLFLYVITLVIWVKTYKIINKRWGALKYIHPIASSIQIASMISAFSNTEGGQIVFGINDDGKRIRVKDFPFSIKEDEISDLLEPEVSFEIKRFNYMNHELAYLNINKSSEIIKCNDIFYAFNKNMGLIQVELKKIFISYCHKDKSVVDIIESILKETTDNRIEVSRDIYRLKYKDSLDEYMQSIKEHDFVVSIVSDAYIKSDACMYEISELMRDRNYYAKLLFVILSESDATFYSEHTDVKNIKADVYSANRFDYIKYWENKKNEIDEKIAIIKNTALLPELANEAKRIEIISLNIGEFISKLKDGLGKSLQEMIDSEFEEFRAIILS